MSSWPARACGAGAPGPGHAAAPQAVSHVFLETLLAQKKQEATLLFANRDNEGAGVVAVPRLRPILTSVFRPPQPPGEAPPAELSLTFDRPSVVALYEELLAHRNVRTVYESVTGRLWKAPGTAAPGMFTLSELHKMMEKLFTTEARDGRRFSISAAIPTRSPSLGRRAVSVPQPLSLKEGSDEAGVAHAEELGARAGVPVWPVSREGKHLDDDDSAPSTSRESSVGGHSSAHSCTTTGLAATSEGTGGAVLLSGGTLRLIPGGRPADAPAAGVPSSQVALMWGSLEEAFAAARGGCVDGRALTGHLWSREEQAAVASILRQEEMARPLSAAPMPLTPALFDAFLQFVLTGK